MLSVFTTILEMSLTASVVILTVLLARALLSKAPKKYAYLLWLVVAFRLCVPFSFESSISIFNTAGAIPTFDIETSTQETVSEDTAVSVTPEISETVSVPNAPVTPDTNEGTASVPEYQPPIHTPVTPNEGTVTVPEGNTTPETPVTPPVNQTPEVSAPAPVTPDETPDETPMVPPVQSPVETPVAPEVPTANQMYTVTVVLTSVWALGVICMLGCGAVSYIKLKKRLQNAVLLYDNVYGSDRIGSPFALGVFRPRIYIPFGLNEEAQAYILAHERYHLKRLDHLVKPLSFAILCVHWFNPLCWFAFSRMSLDMELSCDERVLKQFGDENMKKKYTKTLLDFATDRRYPSPAPISFSEGAGAKTRIKHALYWKKPRFWVSAIAVLLCAVILVACASNAVSNDPSDNSEDTNSDRIIEFGDTPYQFTFASNGDGTCVITDIKTDFDRTEKFDLIIPEKSPDGDTVVEVDMSALGDYKDVFNVPGVLKKETFASIIDRIRSSEFKGESGITAEKAADIVDAFYGRPIGQPSAEHIDEFSYVVLEFLISVEEASRISAYLTDFIGYTAKDCYADCLAVMDLDVNEEHAAMLQEKAFRFFYHDVSNIQKVVLPSKEITVRHNELAIPFALADGTVFEPKYANPVSVGYLTDDVDLFSPDTLHFAEKQSVGDETIMVTTSKTVSKLCFFALDSTDGETFTVENVLLSGVVLTDAQTLVIDTVISETFPNRGIGFLGTDGKMHYYAICWSGFDGSLSLSEITDKVDFPLTLSIRSATDEDKHNDNYLHFTAPGLPVSYDLIIESNQTLENLNVCKIDADDYSDENGWLYTAEPFDTLLGSLTPDKALHLTVYPESITSTYGISFTSPDGKTHVYMIYESELDGALSLIDITDQLKIEQSTNTNAELTKFKVNNTLPFYEAIVTLTDKGLATSLSIRDTKTGKFLQAIDIEDDEYCNSNKKPIAADLNFDHNLDILVLYQTPGRADFYHAFVYDEDSGEFVHAPSFAYIPNYKLDTANNRILGYSQGDMRVNYEVAEYDKKAKDFVFTNSLYYEYNIDDADGDTIRFVEYENGEVVADYTMEGYGNYYLLDENDDRMKPYLQKGSFWDLYSDKWRTPTQNSDETIVATYEVAGGTLYHAQANFYDRLYIRYSGGKETEICKRTLTYIKVSPDGKHVIFDDFSGEYNATVWIYHIPSETLTEQPMDDLGYDYTPAYLDWLDNRYFLFVSQLDHGSIARGGDVYVYDTQDHSYRCILDTYTVDNHSLMINTFAVNGQNITLGGYDYSYDSDLYVDWTHTVTTDFVYDLITRGEFVSFCVNDGELVQKPPQVPDGETLITNFQFQKGYIYHTQNNQTQKHILRAMFYDGTIKDIYEDDCIAYVDFEVSSGKLIWNDYGNSAETTVCVYDLDTDVLYENFVQDLDEGHTVSSMKWYAYHYRYILFVTQPIQGKGIHDGDVYIYDTKYQATVKIIDARDNLRITSIDERAERITAVYYNETDGSYTEMTYRITYEELSTMLEEQYGILHLRAEDCREIVAPLACPVNVAPTDKEPSITFDRHAQEVFAFTFTKDVKGFAIVKIDTGVAYDITVDPLNKPTDYKAGDTLVYAMYINDIGDSRGFVLIGEDGKLHYYALRGPDMAGFTTGYSVVEVTDDPLLTVDGKTPDFNP